MKLFIYLLLLFYTIIFSLVLRYSPYVSLLKVFSVSIHLFYDVIIFITNWFSHSFLMLIELNCARVYISGSFLYFLM